jgi:hypothetical protein
MRSLLLLLPVLLAGCDHIAGVVRQTSQMPSAPSPQCVQEAASSIEGMTNVAYSLEQGGRPLTLHGIEKPDQVHRIQYRYAGVNGNLYFIVRCDGSATYHHTYICINCTPLQSNVDTIYPAMLAIDEAVRSRCGLSAPIHEVCRGIRCGGA